ncbi:MAG: hypothetical protein VX834_07315 [Myxococcota bacterium]|nr:hypothetical protein [Myxococcota bacterium]
MQATALLDVSRERGTVPGKASPLWLLTQQPMVNALVSYLETQRRAIDAAPQATHVLSFSRGHLRTVRSEFADMIRQGEARLHMLCGLLGRSLFSDYEMQSVVIGEVPTTQRRFEHAQRIEQATLFGETDLDLGNRILAQLRCDDGNDWVKPALVANFVEYQPLVENRHGIHKMISRIKAEEEIWNKVCDEIFRIDELLERDKELRALSRYVKDVFGVKVVVGTPDDARKLQTTLESLLFEAQDANGDDEDRSGRMRFVEVKDYLGDSGQKQSGWEAIKSVVSWAGGMFELQIQPLGNYFMERERLTRESHAAFKENRERIRNQLAAEYPLMGFYRDLLRWLFLEPKSSPPRFDGVEIQVCD